MIMRTSVLLLPLLLQVVEVAPTYNLVCNTGGKPSILCLPEDYSKFDLPFKNRNNIKIGFEISDVLKIDDKDYAITFSLYFSVEWYEPRLNITSDFWGAENTTEDELIPVNLELIHSLWVPNIFIYNLKTFQVIDVLSKLAGLWIDKTKRIYYSQATHITFICPMLFDSFPLDTQTCKFQVGSYSYDMARMVFEIATLGYIQRNQSIVMDYEIEIRNLKEEDKIFPAGPLGNYSLAGFEMTLERHVMSYIITYYLPSGLFVVVSWISFLIPPDIVPGRMALLITLFLVLINIFNNVTTNSPKAEGLTAIEIWMLACILFVFGALIEYAMILYKKQKVHHHSPPSTSPSYQESVTTTLNDNGNYPLDTVYQKQETENHNHSCQENHLQLQEHRRPERLELERPEISKPVLLSCHADSPPLYNLRAGPRHSPSSAPVVQQQKSARSFSTWHDRYHNVDRFFLFFSPLLFLIFNMIYWTYFQVWDFWCRSQ